MASTFGKNSRNLERLKAIQDCVTALDEINRNLTSNCGDVRKRIKEFEILIETVLKDRNSDISLFLC